MAMPFRHVASGFRPHELDILRVAFNDAWQQLATANDANIEWERGPLKKKLAQHIIATASTGQFDPKKLTEFALRALLKKQPSALSAKAPVNEGDLPLPRET